METKLNPSTGNIAALNDALRTNLSTTPGNTVVFTPGVLALLGDVSTLRGFRNRAELLRAIAAHEEFTAENDPYGEHDFGSLIFDNQTVFWKIDYYDTNLEYRSPDPANPAVTIRVMSIMLGSEY